MYLGVDGGGTKTALCLVDGTGRVLARRTAPSIYYFASGIELVAEVLTPAVREVCADAGGTPADVAYAFFGMPGYGEASGDVPLLDAVPSRVLGHDRYRCDNDMVAGWAGSLGAVDGVNVISGTGSMTYGERAGQGARVGGWGELFGDEGSAYWIAREGLAAFSRMADGREEAGPLLSVLREHLELSADLDLVDVVLNRWHGDRGRIAALCRPVVAAAEAGDRVCAAIVERAGAELALLVSATRFRLGWPAGEPMPVSYSGGALNAEPLLAAFSRRLHDLGDPVDLRRPLLAPDLGAALHAARLAGHPVDQDAVARLSAHPTPAVA
ncbi:N-acetylglucosamine kinase [Geodermatophilus sp. Leaf369]|uniref:N-acetylglucosamine kinase n=1 Tax=Geodermatophilus sp. Leaf369 TaxID=1736354 RepID=UPI0006FEE902|nr:BadF/BadG/BcrA/BcrD ATPase family protein [Geodermatophilus sp. Leaf369]KQS56973.1 N-acetylglucosamine kinase [Geodermatophilus sp. Leaf369]QNG35536.1 N-acetylglucosamine kinase [Geodermatophilaceae bacterium NBWT11]